MMALMPVAAAFDDYFLRNERISLHVLVLCFSKDTCLYMLRRVCNAVLQQFPTLLTAETNYMCSAGLGKCFLTACQYD